MNGILATLTLYERLIATLFLDAAQSLRLGGQLMHKFASIQIQRRTNDVEALGTDNAVQNERKN